MPVKTYPLDWDHAPVDSVAFGQSVGRIRHALRHRIESEVKFWRVRGQLGMRLVNRPAFLPLADQDLPLVAPFRNDARFVSSFLRHYRSLGVTRFIVVDDRSEDETRELLASEPDVDLWQSDLRYREAMRSRAWREFFGRTYGRARWYINVDSDEYLVYPGSDRGRRLPDFIQTLEAHGIRHCPAPMIDAFAPGPLAAAVFEGRDERMPWDVASHLDASGYTVETGNSALSMKGGARLRLFQSHVDLMKYPLLRWDIWTSYGTSIHRPLPFWRNFSPVCGVLLHFKLFSDLAEKSEQAVADNQYYGGAREYRRFADALGEAEQELSADGAIPYRGANDLVERGFMARLGWRDPAAA